MSKNLGVLLSDLYTLVPIQVSLHPKVQKPQPRQTGSRSFTICLIQRSRGPIRKETEGQGGEQGFPASGRGIKRTHLGVSLQQEQVCR